MIKSWINHNLSIVFFSAVFFIVGMDFLVAHHYKAASSGVESEEQEQGSTVTPTPTTVKEDDATIIEPTLIETAMPTETIAVEPIMKSVTRAPPTRSPLLNYGEIRVTNNYKETIWIRVFDPQTEKTIKSDPIPGGGKRVPISGLPNGSFEIRAKLNGKDIVPKGPSSFSIGKNMPQVAIVYGP